MFIVENGGNTCYIDSLLMALFYTPSHIDGVLNKKLKNDQYSYIQEFIMQKFVNRVRNGKSVSSEEINELRIILITNGWLDFNSIFQQQDVNEFYTFLLDKFDITPIELEKKIYTDNNDNKTIIEKLPFIPLSLPYYKENNSIKVSDMLREWLYLGGVDIKRNNNGIFNDVKDLISYQINNIPEFLTLSINRFPNIENRNNTDVVITKTLKPFSNLVNTDLKNVEWSFHSAVCHKGDNLQSGHYYTLLFKKINKEDKWYIFNDINIPSITEVSMNDKNIIKNIKQDCIFLIYQLKF